MAFQAPYTSFNDGDVEGVTFDNLLTGMERGVKAAVSHNTRAIINNRQYLRIPEQAASIYQSWGLPVIEDPNNPGSYLVDEERYNGDPRVMAQADSNGIGGGVLNNLLTYAPLAGGAALGGYAALGGAPAAGAAVPEAVSGAGTIGNYSLQGAAFPGGGYGTAAAGASADAALTSGAAVNAAAPGTYSLGSGVGGGLGGGATLGASAPSLYSLANGATALGGGASAAAPAVAGTGATALAPAAGTAAAGALSRIMDGTATADDWLSIGGKALGVAAPAIGTYLSANQTNDALMNIYNQQRADRAPALTKYNEYLNNPRAYYEGEVGMGSIDSILRGLSVNGNPAANPGLLAKGAALNMGGYTNFLNSLSGPAFGGQGTQAQLGTAAAGAQGNQYAGLGYGLGQLLNPQPTLADLSKYGLTIGGMKV